MLLLYYIYNDSYNYRWLIIIRGRREMRFWKLRAREEEEMLKDKESTPPYIYKQNHIAITLISLTLYKLVHIAEKNDCKYYAWMAVTRKQTCARSEFLFLLNFYRVCTVYEIFSLGNLQHTTYWKL